MSTSCEYIAKHFLPLYRAFVAKELIENYGYTQVQAAEKLGTGLARLYPFDHRIQFFD